MIQFKHEITEERSSEENRYFHGIIVRDIADFKKWKPNTAKRWIKNTWNIKSTANLTTSQFETLCEDVRGHVIKYWKLYIALPNQ